MMTFAFLSNPPPQKKRPTQPLPPTPTHKQSVSIVDTRRRSFTAIASWAASVQPGSPANSQCKPCITTRRRRSLSRRRSSLANIRLPSNNPDSFLNVIDTPSTANQKEVPIDLTMFGYTSVFVHLPKTPAKSVKNLLKYSAISPKTILPMPPVPQSPPTDSDHTSSSKTVRRFRSLSVLRPRGTRACSKSSAAPKPTSPTAFKAEILTAVVAKKKEAKYVRPPPLASELALMQFMGGGNTESNVKKAMHSQARANGTGVDDVYRDEKGTFWRDEDEVWEYAHLLADEKKQPESDWISFDSHTPSKDALAVVNLLGDRRTSASTLDSDLNPAYIMRTDETDDGLAAFGSTTRAHKPGMSVLALPSRPRRAAKHLRKPEFVVDVAAFGLRSPRSPITFTVKSPRPFTASFSYRMNQRNKVKASRRPAPPALTLIPPAPAERIACPTNSPVDLRKDFLDASFVPPMSATTPTSALGDDFVTIPLTPEPPKKQVAKKPSGLNMRNFFKGRN